MSITYAKKLFISNLDAQDVAKLIEEQDALRVVRTTDIGTPIAIIFPNSFVNEHVLAQRIKEILDA